MDGDLVKIEKLQDGSQFSMWKFQIKVLLKASEIFGLVNGDRIKPERDAANFEAENKIWNKADCKAQKFIVSTVGQQPLQHIMNCETARQMWLKLEAVYEQKTQTNIHLLQQRFYSYVRDPQDSMATYISKLETIVKQLQDLGENISNSMVTTKILMTLPPNFNHFNTAWESTAEKDRTLENLTSRLVMEEARLLSQDSVEFGGALAASKYKVYSKTPQRSEHRTNVKPGKCFQCKKKGHWKQNCPLRNVNKNHSNSSHVAKGDAFISEAMLNEQLAICDEWFLDSGASDHMTNRREWFVTFNNLSKPIPVRVGNGETIYAYGKGEINVLAFNNAEWVEKHLSNVLFVPEIRLNLFSSNCALDKGLKLESDQNRCLLTKNGHIVAVGVRKRKLFQLMFKVESTNNDDVAVYSAVKQSSLQLWHERMGHQHFAHVRRFLKSMKIMFTEDAPVVCNGCILGKHHRLSFQNSFSKASAVGKLVHSDLCGPMQVQSIGGARYFLLLKDDFSHFRTVFFIKEKSEVHQLIGKYIKDAKANDVVIKMLRTDNGTEYVNKKMELLLQEYNIVHQRSVPYTPEQNGSAEREMRTIVEAARSMLHSKKLDLKFWAEAVNCAVYVLNRTGPSPVDAKTPYELWYHKKAEINNLRVFGSKVYAHVPKVKRQKWDPKANTGLFLGYCDNVKGYRFWNERTCKVEISRDIVFEEHFEGSLPSTENTNVVVLDDDVVDIHSDTPVENIERKVSESDSIDDLFLDSNDEVPETGTKEKVDFKSKLRSATRACTSNSNIAILEDGYAFVLESDEPQDYEDAIHSKYKDLWQTAMNDEMCSLNKNKTWQLVDPPKHRKIISNRWVFRIKKLPDGKTDRYKARLVVRGFTQRYGVDYTETFSPVVKFSSVRSILAVAASENLILKQFDVKTAFLYGLLNEDIYMEQPIGYNDGTGRVCKLFKSLYGLKQSSRCWNQQFSEFLQKFNFKISTCDPCVFISNQNGNKMVLAIYIDDGLIAAKRSVDIANLLEYLQLKFEIKVFDASIFLGLEICHTGRGIHICQRSYAKKILERFNMIDAHPVATPIDQSIFAVIDDEQHVSNVVKYPYREAIGSLMYLAVATRPDIAFALGSVSRYMENPKQVHINAIKRLLRYLKGTLDYGIVFDYNERLILAAYSDADYAGDVVTRRSTSGFVFMLGSGAVSWCSQRQKCVSLSTTESEYVAASEAVKELVWLSSLIKELMTGFNIATLYMDNQSAIRLIKNPEFHKRSKHIDVRFHFIREKYEEKLFELNYVPSAEQTADILTKPLAKDIFEYLRLKMGIIVIDE